MSETSWISVCGLHLLLLFLTRSQLTDSLHNDGELYEGSPCPLQHGAEELGVCVKTANCPAAVTGIQKGDYNHIRCGFSNFDEIICCEKIENRIRPADSACEKYKKIIPGAMWSGYVVFDMYNGDFAKDYEFPHMAALAYVASDDEEGAVRGRKYLCGGTLISQKHVITAAHCVSNFKGLVPIEVVLGTIDLTNPNLETMQSIPISRIIKHPQFKNSQDYHDIAILELQNMAQITASVQPTCLMTKPLLGSFETRNQKFNILGWGVIDYEETTSTELLKSGALKFRGSNSCSMFHTRDRIPNGFDDEMICSNDVDDVYKVDTCVGDSGGALQVSSGKFPPLIGITLSGQVCGGGLGIYVLIYNYLDWIEEQVWPA